jgi:hypothetical protein
VAAPVNPADGDFITRGFWVREISDRWSDLIAPWLSYTPVWTAVSGSTATGVGGSITGSYKRIGSVACLRLRLVIGSTGVSLGTGAWSFTLPADAAPSGTRTITGWASNQAGSVRHPVSAFLTTAGGVNRMGINNNLVGGAVPFSWADQDQLVLGGEYEWAP